MWNYPEPHFRAIISILPLGPNARASDPHNGVRWNVVFKEDYDEHGAGAIQRTIWPLFRLTDETVIPQEVPLQGALPATMHIMFPEMDVEHLKKVRVGGEFYCMEGARVVAHGRVTEICHTRLE